MTAVLSLLLEVRIQRAFMLIRADMSLCVVGKEELTGRGEQTKAQNGEMVLLLPSVIHRLF